MDVVAVGIMFMELSCQKKIMKAAFMYIITLNYYVVNVWLNLITINL